ncbi:hypothetical protein CNMCM5623_009131 [Aspergillus felis]|uniref:Uncharacterized protein n=1 Tax=Aspergillus felis TaxID=1287682 RepID=A0A8H6Q2R2_9EURO|nr:hypothetical protein CNMCM5623_009131 [Aspergillus felis]KAF7177827.1 hypothetical protein CNMCM7691_006282 [Aspergillus felis]
MKEEETTPTIPASKPDEASVEPQLLSSKQKELAVALSSYVGFPERLMQKAGCYKYPFLFLVYLFAFLFGYYRTCQLVCAADTCYLQALFLYFLCFCFLALMAHRGAQRDAILRDAGEELLRGSLK